MDDFLSKLYDKFSSEYGAENVKKIMNELIKEKEEEKRKPYKVIDYPPDKQIKQNFSQEDVDSLRFGVEPRPRSLARQVSVPQQLLDLLG